MTAAVKPLTLEEYYARNNNEEKHYELVAGQPTEMPPESPQNAEIAIKLLLIFAQFVSTRLLRCKDTEIVVSGSRATVRLPDLMVLTEELANDLYSNNKSTIGIDMLPPALVVEVVSPGKANQDRDYRYKRCSAVLGGAYEFCRKTTESAPWLSPMSDTESTDSRSLRDAGAGDIKPAGNPQARALANAPFKKRSEYAARGIAEYWIVDPEAEKLTLLLLNDGLYEEKIYRTDELISSTLFPQLQLAAKEIFVAK